MDSPSSHLAPGTRGSRLSARRTALTARKRAERQIARRRIARNTRRPPTSAQLAFDPLARPGHRKGRRTARFWIAIVASLLVHVAAIGFGVSFRSRRFAGGSRQEVKILVRQKPPEPPPEKKPEPPPPVEKPDRIPPKIAKAPPPERKPEPPPPPTKAPPVRVVGLSLESTTEGGSGPAFAVGNTRAGETATRAVAPKDVSPAPPENAPSAAVARGPGKSNSVASHIPVAGMKYENPKPRGGNKLKPPYPPTLRSQGIEDDVTVLVAIDVTGRVTSVKVIKPSQYPEMNEAARATALVQEWDPATRNGEPMSQSISYTYRFRLEDE